MLEIWGNTEFYTIYNVEGPMKAEAQVNCPQLEGLELEVMQISIRKGIR
jgi:hypothetical protein